jgi:hypothetical protein
VSALIAIALLQASRKFSAPTSVQFEAMLARFGDRVSLVPGSPLRRAVIHNGENLHLDELPKGTEAGPWVVGGLELHAFYSLPAMLPRKELQQWALANLRPSVRVQSYLSGAITVDEYIDDLPQTESEIKTKLDNYCSDLAAIEKQASLRQGRHVDDLEAVQLIPLDQSIVLETLTRIDAMFLVQKSGWPLRLDYGMGGIGGGFGGNWRFGSTVDGIDLALREDPWDPGGVSANGFSIESEIFLSKDEMAQWRKHVASQVKWGRIKYEENHVAISVEVNLASGMSVAVRSR